MHVSQTFGANGGRIHNAIPVYVSQSKIGKSTWICWHQDRSSTEFGIAFHTKGYMSFRRLAAYRFNNWAVLLGFAVLQTSRLPVCRLVCNLTWSPCIYQYKLNSVLWIFKFNFVILFNQSPFTPLWSIGPQWEPSSGCDLSLWPSLPSTLFHFFIYCPSPCSSWSPDLPCSLWVPFKRLLFNSLSRFSKSMSYPSPFPSFNLNCYWFFFCFSP